MTIDPTLDPVRISAQLPAAVQTALQSMGRVVAPQPSEALFAPLHSKAMPQDVRIERDVPYGPNARNRLDIFTPANATEPLPVLLFVHGGAFMRGDRRIGDGTFHDNIGLWAARNGMVGVNMSYRLAPEHGWPCAQRDIQSAIQHLRTAPAGNKLPNGPMVLMGHSAGAAHVAQYVAMPEFHQSVGVGVRAAVVLSGLFDPVTAEDNPPLKAYFGADRARYPERNAVPGLVTSAVPLWIGYAELDPPDFVEQAHQLGTALQRAGKPTPVHRLDGHSHMSELYAIGTADTSLSEALIRFMRKAASLSL
ncbi:MAG: alpha/beta hydrolase [Rhodoferax sp.]|uniref:alpha/beta hydrolase n=1 Tax=Rhodoferax sp. TaxID=50421 RepID=UPI002ACD2217|nr:alpha/beta hydrolase [Rhodoferax sp.]MDZ7892515.1 alpha/beta hydrolase [Rhodoferax sp.]